MTTSTASDQTDILRSVVSRLLDDLQNGVGDKEKRRHVEEWMRAMADKYPEFRIEEGLGGYYVAEAKRRREEFESTEDMTARLGLGREIELLLEKAADVRRRLAENDSSEGA